MAKGKKKNREHFLVYYDNNHNIVSIKPREWSRQNKRHFPEYTFKEDDAPKDNVIETYLKDNYGFVEFTYKTTVVLCNLDAVIQPNEKGVSF